MFCIFRSCNFPSGIFSQPVDVTNAVAVTPNQQPLKRELKLKLNVQLMVFTQLKQKLKKVTKQLKRSAAVLAYFVSAFYVQMCDGRHFKHRFISVLFQFYFN